MKFSIMKLQDSIMHHEQDAILLAIDRFLELREMEIYDAYDAHKSQLSARWCAACAVSEFWFAID